MPAHGVRGAACMAPARAAAQPRAVPPHGTPAWPRPAAHLDVPAALEREQGRAARAARGAEQQVGVHAAGRVLVVSVPQRVVVGHGGGGEAGGGQDQRDRDRGRGALCWHGGARRTARARAVRQLRLPGRCGSCVREWNALAGADRGGPGLCAVGGGRSREPAWKARAGRSRGPRAGLNAIPTAPRSHGRAGAAEKPRGGDSRRERGGVRSPQAGWRWRSGMVEATGVLVMRRVAR